MLYQLGPDKIFELNGVEFDIELLRNRVGQTLIEYRSAEYKVCNTLVCDKEFLGTDEEIEALMQIELNSRKCKEYNSVLQSCEIIRKEYKKLSKELKAKMIKELLEL